MAKNKVIFGNTTIMDITDTTAEASDVANGQVFYDRGGNRTVGTGNYMDKVDNPVADDILVTDSTGQAVDSGVNIDDVVQFTDVATSSNYGVVKLNPNESVDVNANGQLTVGGRLGQFPNGGVFYPTTIEPINVGGSTFLITDGAVNLSAGSRQMIIAGGNNLKLKGSHPAGSTEYHIQNTLSNRFGACAAKGGRLALTQASAAEKTVAILSIKVNGLDLVAPYSGATDNTNDIIITVDESLNPDSALANNTNIRPYGNFGNSDVLSVGQLHGTSGGKVLEIGMQLRAEGNQVMLFGNGCYSNANNSVCLGHSHINNGKQFAALLGQGHDTTNGRNGVGAVGMWSVIGADTMFVVGKGTDDLNRSNAFEVTQDGGIIVPSSTSGSTKKFKITVDDTGTISATEVV